MSKTKKWLIAIASGIVALPLVALFDVLLLTGESHPKVYAIITILVFYLVKGNIDTFINQKNGTKFSKKEK